MEARAAGGARGIGGIGGGVGGGVGSTGDIRGIDEAGAVKLTLLLMQSLPRVNGNASLTRVVDPRRWSVGQSPPPTSQPARNFENENPNPEQLNNILTFANVAVIVTIRMTSFNVHYTGRLQRFEADKYRR